MKPSLALATVTPHGLDWVVVGVAAWWLLIAVFVGLRLWATRHRYKRRPGPLPPEVTRAFMEDRRLG